MSKKYPICLVRKYTNHICGTMILSEPMQKIIRFEKDFLSYESDSLKRITFQKTDGKIDNHIVFREVNEDV